MSGYTIREMISDDEEQSTALMNDQGWNIPDCVLGMTRRRYPQGFYVAVTDDRQVISMCATSALSDEIGFCNYYVTKGENRGQGIGTKVFKAAMSAMGDRNVGMNSVEYMKSKYESVGFVLTGQLLIDYMVTPVSKCWDFDGTDNIELVEAGHVPIDALVAYDNTIQVINRKATLQQYVDVSEKFIVAKSPDSSIIGIGCLCKGPEAYKIMFLYADQAPVADGIIAHLLRSTPPGSKVNFTICDCNTEMKKIMDRYGLSGNTCTCATKLYTKKNLVPSSRKIYCVNSFEMHLI